MAEQKDNRFLKILLAILLLGIVGLSIWSYKTYQENKQVQTELNDEKAQIQMELENISSEYTIEIDKGNMLTSDLTNAKDRITRLVDSVSRLESNVKVLSILRRELNNIKKERDLLNTRISTLELVNENLTKVNDSTLAVLNTEILRNENQNSTIESMNTNLARAATLIPTNFNPVGVIVRSSGSQKEHEKARRVDDVKVCFTLPANPLATTGITTFYLQVISPDNNVMGENKTEMFEDQKLNYSRKIQFNYKGKELDICELTGVDEDKIVSGRYRVNLFNGPIRISSSEMTITVKKHAARRAFLLLLLFNKHYYFCAKGR